MLIGKEKRMRYLVFTSSWLISAFNEDTYFGVRFIKWWQLRVQSFQSINALMYVKNAPWNSNIFICTSWICTLICIVFYILLHFLLTCWTIWCFQPITSLSSFGTNNYCLKTCTLHSNKFLHWMNFTTIRSPVSIYFSVPKQIRSFKRKINAKHKR